MTPSIGQEIQAPSPGGTIEIAQGLPLATQWFDWTETATTNAIQWTVPSTPTLGMALVEGHPLETTGRVAVHKAHVPRLSSSRGGVGRGTAASRLTRAAASGSIRVCLRVQLSAGVVQW